MRCPDCGYLLLNPEAHCPKCEKTLEPGPGAASSARAEASGTSVADDEIGDVSYPSFSNTGSTTGTHSRASGALATAAALAWDDDDSSDPNLPPTGEAQAEPERPGLRVVDITEEESVGDTTENHFPVDLEEADEAAEPESAEVDEGTGEVSGELTGEISAAEPGEATSNTLDNVLGEATDWSGFFREVAARDELAREEAAAESEEETSEGSRSDNIVDAEEALEQSITDVMEVAEAQPGDSTGDAVELGDEVTGSVVNDPTPIPELPPLLRDDEPSTPRIEEEIARAEAIATDGFATGDFERGATGDQSSGTDPVFAAAFDALQSSEAAAEPEVVDQTSEETGEISDPKAAMTLPTAVVHPYELPVEDPEEGARTATEIELEPAPVSLESLVANEDSIDLSAGRDAQESAARDVPDAGDSLWDTTAFAGDETGESTEVTPSVFDEADLDAVSSELPEEPSLPSVPSTTPSAFDAIDHTSEETDSASRSLTSPKQIDLEDAIARARAAAPIDGGEDPGQTVVSAREDPGEKTLVSNPRIPAANLSQPARMRTQISFPHFSVPSHPASAQALGTDHERSGDFPTADILGEVSTRLSAGALPTRRTFRNKAAGRRLIAFAVDNLTSLAMACGFVFLAHLATGVGIGGARGSAGGASMIEVAAAVLVLRMFLDGLYQVSYVALTGQTPGLRLLGLRVRSETSRQRPSLPQALRRWLWSYWLTYGICWGFLAVSRDPRGRALHDKKARTRIVPA